MAGFGRATATLDSRNGIAPGCRAERRRLGEPGTASAAAAAALFEISPLAGVHDVRKHVAAGRIGGDAALIAAADRAGKDHRGPAALFHFNHGV